MSDTVSIFPSNHYRDALYAQLKLMPIKKIRIEFQGGGDSGEIHSIYAYARVEGESINLSSTNILWGVHDYNAGQTVEKLLPLDKVLEEIGYAALDMTNLDWYNNDGGQGSVEIVLDDGEPYVYMNMGLNVVHTEEHVFDSREGDFGDREED